MELILSISLHAEKLRILKYMQTKHTHRHRNSHNGNIRSKLIPHTINSNVNRFSHRSKSQPKRHLKSNKITLSINKLRWEPENWRCVSSTDGYLVVIRANVWCFSDAADVRCYMLAMSIKWKKSKKKQKVITFIVIQMWAIVNKQPKLKILWPKQWKC